MLANDYILPDLCSNDPNDAAATTAAALLEVT